MQVIHRMSGLYTALPPGVPSPGRGSLHGVVSRPANQSPRWSRWLQRLFVELEAIGILASRAALVWVPAILVVLLVVAAMRAPAAVPYVIGLGGLGVPTALLISSRRKQGTPTPLQAWRKDGDSDT